MFGEIGIAAGLLGKAFEFFKKDDKADAAGGEGFAAMMAGAGGTGGIQIASYAPAEKSVGGAESADAEAKAAMDYIHDMTDGGLEAAMRRALEKIREKVMASMGVTQADLDAMPPEQRVGMEAKIAEEMQKKMKEAMGADGVKTANEPESFAAKLLEMAKAYKPEVSIV